MSKVLGRHDSGPVSRVMDIACRLKPVLVHATQSKKRRIILVPWSVVLRGRVYVGERVRFLRGATVDARGGRIEIGDGSVICRFAVLESAGGDIVIGKRVAVGDFSNLYGQGGLSIADDVLIASGARIVPSSHTWDNPELPISKQPIVGTGIRIGEGVWLGTNVVVLDGVTLGDHSIIGAASVVTKGIDRMAIAVGVPAAVKRFRSEG